VLGSYDNGSASGTGRSERMMERSVEFIAALQASDDGHHAEAARLMEQCALKGDPVACYFMALWYRDGEGVRASAAQSKHWMQEMERLAEADNAEAQWELGQSLRFGNLSPSDIGRANYWLERAATNGWGEAQHHLAWYLETGQYGYAVDRETGEMWYRCAFEQEHPETLYTFALREFEDGKLTEKAIALLTKAAKKGFKQAARVLKEYRH
jgi:TPR repeat protein